MYEDPPVLNNMISVDYKRYSENKVQNVVPKNQPAFVEKNSFDWSSIISFVWFYGFIIGIILLITNLFWIKYLIHKGKIRVGWLFEA